MDASLYRTAVHALRERVGESALAHCERVAETAAALADVYGQDSDLARLAGLLHDWDRDQDHAGLVESAVRNGIAVTEVDERWPYLLHAKTAAADLAMAFPELPAEVLSAIASHTVGAPDMSDLDRVVFLADMLEPARHYEGVEELRAAVGHVDLDELFARGYEASLMRLVARRRRIHPDTVAVWNALVARGPR